MISVNALNFGNPKNIFDRDLDTTERALIFTKNAVNSMNAGNSFNKNAAIAQNAGNSFNKNAAIAQNTLDARNSF